MKTVRCSFVFLLCALSMVATVTSCTQDKIQLVVNDCPEIVSYAQHVAPMIAQSCATTGCHASNSSSGGYDLEGHANVATNASIILNVLRHETGVVAMPIGAPKLTDSLIQQFQCWVDQGKLDN